MNNQTFNAQTRIPMVLMEDVQKRLDNSGMTVSEYIRNLIMIDIGKFPISIPEIKLDSDQEKRILDAIKESKEKKGRVFADKKEVGRYLDSLLKDE